MTTQDVGNAPGDAIGRVDTRADKGAGTGADLSGNALARIWKGQIQLRQEMQNASSTETSCRNR